MLVNQPSSFRLDKDQYSVNVQLSWFGLTPGAINPPGFNQPSFPQFTAGLADDVNLLSYAGNIILPDFHSVIGTINFGGSGTNGPAFLLCPDTGQIVSIPAPTGGTYGLVSFALPLLSAGKHFQVIKVTDQPAGMTGTANLTFCTFDIQPFIIR